MHIAIFIICLFQAVQSTSVDIVSCDKWNDLFNSPWVESRQDLLGVLRSRLRVAMIGFDQDDIRRLVQCNCERFSFDASTQEHGSILAATWKCANELELAELHAPSAKWSAIQWEEYKARMSGKAEWATALGKPG